MAWFCEAWPAAGSRAGPAAAEQLIGLPHERLGACQVGELDMVAG